MAAKLVAGHDAGGEREPRPGCPDVAGARGWVPGWPGRRPGALETLGRSGTGDGHQSGIIQRDRVAVEQSCVVPVAGTQEGAAARRVRVPVPSSR